MIEYILMIEVASMVIAGAIFVASFYLGYKEGYKAGQQTNKVTRQKELAHKVTLRNMYNDIKEFIKPDEDEQRKDRKTPEQAEQDEKGENQFFT